MNELLSPDFIFNATPVYQSIWYLPLSIFFGVLLVAGLLVLFLLKGEAKVIFGRYDKPLIITGALGLIHLGSRYEGLPWLASGLFFYLVLVTLLIWLIVNMIALIRFAPKYTKEKKVQEKFEKYLPGKKEKRTAKGL